MFPTGNHEGGQWPATGDLKERSLSASTSPSPSAKGGFPTAPTSTLDAPIHGSHLVEECFGELAQMYGSNASQEPQQQKWGLQQAVGRLESKLHLQPVSPTAAGSSNRGAREGHRAAGVPSPAAAAASFIAAAVTAAGGGWTSRNSNGPYPAQKQQQQQEEGTDPAHSNGGTGSSSDSPECNPDITELFAQLTDDMRQHGVLPSAQTLSLPAGKPGKGLLLAPASPAAGAGPPGDAARDQLMIPMPESADIHGEGDAQADVDAALQAAAVFAWSDVD